MATVPVRYFIELGGRSFEARELAGHEGLSRPFRFDARFAVESGAALDPETFVRARVTVLIARQGEVARRIDGIVTDVSVGASIRGALDVALSIEPRLSLSRFRRDLRIFRDRSVPEIVQEVLAGIGIAPVLRLSDAYAPRPYCVQMRETDLDFVSRLLEDEGIFYFFLEGDVMVLGDSSGAYEAIGGRRLVEFRAAAGLRAEGAIDADEVIFEIGQRAALTAGKVTLRDFNPDHPSLDMDVEATVPGSTGPEHYDFPGEYALPAEGARKARLRAEAFAGAGAVLSGASSCGRLAPGHRFEMTLAPEGVDDGEYVVKTLDHSFRREEGRFANAFEALGADVAHRPPLDTPAPTLVNPMIGYVTGPPGEDIHTNALGRVKVHFPWDRVFDADDTCSDWVPVLQDNTGHSIGIPRVGWEVLVHFLEGDPDRPVVLGRLYNGADPFPEPLPAGKTRSLLQSLSSPSREGCNAIRFEDSGGAEQLLIHAERDQAVLVANDKREDVVADEGRVIARDEVIAIGADHREAIGGDFVMTIDGNQTLSVDRHRTRNVGGTSSGTIDGDRSVAIAASHTRRIGTDDLVEAAKIKEHVGAVICEASVGDNSTSAGASMSLLVGGALVEIARKDTWEEAKVGRLETIGGVVFSKSGKKTEASTQIRVTNVGGALKITATKDLAIKGAVEVAAQSALCDLTGAKSITLAVGDTAVTLGEGKIQFKASKEISFDVNGPSNHAASESSQI